MDRKIAETYVKQSKAVNSASSYNSYIKAFRWATDRISESEGGIVGFITNGGWLDSNSQDGFRNCLENEYSKIYIINLRGNANSSGEFRKKEGGNIFGSGTKTPVTITLLVKKQKDNVDQKATIHYYEIDDYLNEQEKLNLLKVNKSIFDIGLQIIIPNDDNDWIKQRNNSFSHYISIGDKKEKGKATIFKSNYSNGVKTNRDPWVYNFSKSTIEKSMKETISIYNKELEKFKVNTSGIQKPKADNYINFSNKMITWTRETKWDLEKGKSHKYESDSIVESNYRPFVREFLYFNNDWNNMRYLMPALFPTKDSKNLLICVPAPGGNKQLSVLISNRIVDIHYNGDTQCFPLYYYEKTNRQQKSLFDEGSKNEYVRREGISDFILERATKQYGKTVNKEDIFYYVYGFLNSKEYCETFANDFKKMLPRLPLVEDVRDFWKFSKAGRALAELHLNYETVAPFADVTVTGDDGKFYTVEKMRFPKKDQKDTIIYNSKISITNIPAKAYEYVVNGKSAIEWIMERYAVTTHKESQITNNPNDWAEEVGKPRYILDLLLSIINVSVQTVDIVNGLPKIDFVAETSEGKEVNLYPTREEGDNLSIAAEPKLNE